MPTVAEMGMYTNIQQIASALTSLAKIAEEVHDSLEAIHEDLQNLRREVEGLKRATQISYREYRD